MKLCQHTYQYRFWSPLLCESHHLILAQFDSKSMSFQTKVNAIHLWIHMAFTTLADHRESSLIERLVTCQFLIPSQCQHIACFSCRCMKTKRRRSMRWAAMHFSTMTLIAGTCTKTTLRRSWIEGITWTGEERKITSDVRSFNFICAYFAAVSIFGAVHPQMVIFFVGGTQGHVSQGLVHFNAGFTCGFHDGCDVHWFRDDGLGLVLMDHYGPVMCAGCIASQKSVHKNVGIVHNTPLGSSTLLQLKCGGGRLSMGCSTVEM